MKYSIVSLSLVLLLVCSTVYAQEEKIPDGKLTIDMAVELALEYHPTLRAADAALRSAKAGLTQAFSGYLPSISATASDLRTEGTSAVGPDFPLRELKYFSYTAAIQANETIYDFGKTTNRYSASSNQVVASESDYQSVKSNVILNVELAYFGYVQAKQIVKVNEEAVTHADEHLKQAKAFFSAGKRAQIDVTKAEVDLANANVGLIQAKNQLRIGKLQLENALGVHPAGSYDVQDTLDVEQFDIQLNAAQDRAMGSNPEYLSASARVSANQSLISAAWDQHLPTLTATGTYTWTNFGFPLYSRWTAGVTMSVPIFQGFAIDAQVKQAQAAADAAEANLETLTENIKLDVEQNYLGMKEAQERITATDKLVQQAEEGLTLAEKQYAAGVGGAIDVSDAQLALSNARITRIKALYDYNNSLIKLKRVIGTIE